MISINWYKIKSLPVHVILIDNFTNMTFLNFLNSKHVFKFFKMKACEGKCRNYEN